MAKIGHILFYTLIFLVCSPVQTQELVKGLHYRKLTTPLQQTIHILDVNPRLLKILPAHAEDKAIARQTVEEIAKHHKAIAAINGGFFKTGESPEGFSLEGLPAGILRIQGKWFGIAYKPRGAIGWSLETQIPLIDRVQTKTRVTLNQANFPVHAVNQPGSPFNATLYTTAYGKVADSPPGNQDIVIQDNRIVALNEEGLTAIPQDGYVYSFGPKVRKQKLTVKKGQTATVNFEVIPERFEHFSAWKSLDNIVSGTPVLISHGKILPLRERSGAPLSSFLHERHARTAVGTLKNGGLDLCRG